MRLPLKNALAEERKSGLPKAKYGFRKTGVLLELIFKDDAAGRRDIIVFWVLLLFTGFQFLSHVTKA